MSRYMVMVKVIGSRHIEADSHEQALALAADEAQATAREIEDGDILGGCWAIVEDVVSEQEPLGSIPLGLLANKVFHGPVGDQPVEWHDQ